MNDTLAIDLLDDPTIRESDARAVMDHYVDGTPLDPTIAARIRARSNRITERVHRKFGDLNLAVDLIREVHDRE